MRFAECPRCGGLLEYYDAMLDWYRCHQCGKVIARKDLGKDYKEE